MSRTRWATVLGSLIVVLALSACSGGGEEATDDAVAPTGEAPAAGAPANLVATDFAFSPTELTVPAGGSLEFVNDGAAPHGFTIDEADIADEVDPGGQGLIALVKLEPGSYDFHCQFHESMTGTLTIT